MGLISRVSSRTYRKKKTHIMSQAVVWSIVRQNHAYLVKSKRNGGVQFSKHPPNLKNKNTLKYSGIANSKTVAIQADAATKGVSMKLGNAKPVVFKGIRGPRPIVVRSSNAVGRFNPALKAVARKRVSALLRSQK